VSPSASPEQEDSVAQFIPAPTRIQAHGLPPKVIEEFVGQINTRTAAVSIARMVSPSGWSEPGQIPEFDEYTIVLRGALTVETRDGMQIVNAGQAIITSRGEWVRYSSPAPDGAEYIAVCMPAFTPETVRRDC
jgi:quercetin dioxygenase-like cupin family protein